MKKYLNISEIARITNKERSTVFRWVKAGKLGQVHKVGNEYQVPLTGFERWWSTNVQQVDRRKGDE